MLKSLCYQAGEEIIWYLGREQDTFAQQHFRISDLDGVHQAVLFCIFDSRKPFR